MGRLPARHISFMEPNQGVGFQVAAAGDVNGDGFADVMIGAQHVDLTNPIHADGGETYIVYGSALGANGNLTAVSLNGQNGFRIEGIATGDESGQALGGNADVNGDGFDDMIIGAHAANSGAGQAYLVLGS